MISAQIVADSICNNHRITSIKCTMPRIILAEFNTHRMFSRNTASSRAIPFNKMVQSIKENPFMPIAWQKDHQGMQGSEYFNKERGSYYYSDLGSGSWYETDTQNVNIGLYKLTKEELDKEWLRGRDSVVMRAENLSQIGATKQLCNRLLETFMWSTVLVTATEWENFFALRCPKYQWEEHTFRSKKDLIEWVAGDDFTLRDEMVKYSPLEWLQLNKGQAEIHMMQLAEFIWDAMNESNPTELAQGEWHIPYGNLITTDLLHDQLETSDYLNNIAHCSNTYDSIRIKISTAMCARTSYTLIGEEGKKPNFKNDLKLHDKLSTSGHWSPFEHCARAKARQSGEDTGNFKGWVQYRKTFVNENITK